MICLCDTPLPELRSLPSHPEFAYFFNAFGTEVTIVEMLPNVLPVEDTDISLALEKSLTRQGIISVRQKSPEKLPTPLLQIYKCSNGFSANSGKPS